MKKEKLKIYYEDKNLILVYKKSGIPTIKSDNYRDNLYSMVFDYLHKKNQKIFVVHRLDKDTSGLVIFAKSEKVRDNLQLNWDNVKREYIAIVHGITSENGVIKSYLKETKTLYSYSSDDKVNGKYAETHYERLDYNKQYSLLKINILTGRKNQIRVHMQDNNTPILGDRKYGKKDGFRNMMLLANSLDFINPVTRERVHIDIGVPQTYLSVMENAR